MGQTNSVENFGRRKPLIKRRRCPRCPRCPRCRNCDKEIKDLVSENNLLKERLILAANSIDSLYKKQLVPAPTLPTLKPLTNEGPKLSYPAPTLL